MIRMINNRSCDAMTGDTDCYSTGERDGFQRTDSTDGESQNK